LVRSGALAPGWSRRWLWAGLIAGALIRAWLVPLPGSPDVSSWKSWSFVGANDPTGLYGVGGDPPVRRLLRWQGIAGTTEYPPLALYEIALAGRVYASFGTTFEDSPQLTALIKAPGLAAELFFVAALILWGKRMLAGDQAYWVALAFWLNPAVVLNGAALGYLDAQMAVPAALALLAAAAARPAIAGGLIAAAVLTKAQAIFVIPIVMLAAVTAGRATRRQAVLAFAAGGAAVSLLVLLPIVLRGAWPNMLQAISRLAAHDMLSGNALNIWWLVTWIVRASYALDLGWFTAFTLPVRILGSSRFMEIGYPNPKPIGTAMVLAAIGWALWRARTTRSLADWAFVAGWCVFAYAMLGAQVHENHFYLAVPFLAIAAGASSDYRPIFWAVSVSTAFNMYIFYGLSEGWPSLIGRAWTIVDLTVIAALANVVLLVLMTRRLARVTSVVRSS
jgi:hypothetical protein